MNKRYQKSAIETYNNVTTSVPAGVATLPLLGTIATETGCSLEATATGITVRNSGLYYLAADVTFTPTADGAETIQLYMNESPLPCAVSQTTGATGEAFTTHVETVLPITACCAVKPIINVRASGVTGGANFVSFTAFKLA